MLFLISSFIVILYVRPIFSLVRYTVVQLAMTSENVVGSCDVCGYYATAKLRFFFGDYYPSSDVRRSEFVTDCGAVRPLRFPEWGRGDFIDKAISDADNIQNAKGIAQFGKAMGKMVIRYIQQNYPKMLKEIYNLFSIVKDLLTVGGIYDPDEPVDPAYDAIGQFSLDLRSYREVHWYEAYHSEVDDDCWEELISLAKAVSELKQMDHPLANIAPSDENYALETSENLTEARETPLRLENGQVHIDEQKIPLGSEETVVNALPIQPRMSWYEFLFVPASCFAKKFAGKSAIILTSARAFSVTETRKGTRKYEFAVNCYYLGQLGEGLIIEDPRARVYGYSLDIATSYGGLRIRPVISGKYPWTKLITAKYKPAFRHLIYSLQKGSQSQKKLNAPAKDFVDARSHQRGSQKAKVFQAVQEDLVDVSEEDLEYIRENIQFWDDEEICSIAKAYNHHNADEFEQVPQLAALSMGDEFFLQKFLHAATCHCRPLYKDQILILTTHRLLAYHGISNGCGIELFKRHERMLLWAPLSEVKSLKLQGSYTYNLTGAAYRLANIVLPCLFSPSVNHIKLTAGFRFNFDFPFNIGRYSYQEDTGKLWELDTGFRHFAQVFNRYYLNSKPTTGRTIPRKVSQKYGGRLPFPERGTIEKLGGGIPAEMLNPYKNAGKAFDNGDNEDNARAKTNPIPNRITSGGNAYATAGTGNDYATADESDRKDSYTEDVEDNPIHSSSTSNAYATIS